MIAGLPSAVSTVLSSDGAVWTWLIPSSNSGASLRVTVDRGTYEATSFFLYHGLCQRKELDSAAMPSSRLKKDRT